jgi:hypothetical protein
MKLTYNKRKDLVETLSQRITRFVILQYQIPLRTKGQ